MTLPSSGSLSIVDIVHEFRSAAFGTITGNLVQQDTYQWFFTVGSVITVNVNDIVFQDSFSTNNLQYGRVLAVGYPGGGVTNLSVLWNPGYAPSVGMVLRHLPSSGLPMRLSDYYSGRGLVPAGTVGYPGGVPTAIPSSGQLKISNFYGATKTSYVLSLNDTPINIDWRYDEFAGFVAQAFGKIQYSPDGVLAYIQGDNGSVASWNYLNESWINSTPDGGNRGSVAANYDFEWEFVSGDTFNRTLGPNILGVTTVWTHTITPAFGVRVNMGSNYPLLERQVEVRSSGNPGTIRLRSSIQVRAKIYSAGTNSLLSSTLHSINLNANLNTSPA